MKCSPIPFLFGLMLLLSSSVSAGDRLNVDWSKFLERHDLVWTRAPQAWHDGPFMGNGMLGTMRIIDELLPVCRLSWR